MRFEFLTQQFHDSYLGWEEKNQHWEYQYFVTNEVTK